MKNIFKGKKILITGGTGLIGSNLANKLMLLGAYVTITSRSKHKIEKSFPEFYNNCHFCALEQNLTNEIEDIESYDFIFHAAGPVGREYIITHPVDVITPNILGTINLLDSLKKSSKKEQRIIIFSSVTIYNNNTNKDMIVTEADSTSAPPLEVDTSCYSESKRMSEVIATSYVKQYGIDAVIARFSTVYGIPRNLQHTAFYEFIDKALKGENIVLNGSNFGRRDNIFTDDAVEGLLYIAAKGVKGEAYNISSGGEKNNYAAIDEIANTVADCVAEYNKKERINVFVKENTNRRPGLILNNSKLKSLGWKLNVDMKTGILETIKGINDILQNN